MIDQLKLEYDNRQNIKTPEEKYNASAARVFAAGDCRKGQSLVVWAIHEGKWITFRHYFRNFGFFFIT